MPSAVDSLQLLICQLELAKQGSDYHWRRGLMLQGLPEEVPTLQQPLSFTHEQLYGLNGHEKPAKCISGRCTSAVPLHIRAILPSSLLPGILHR